MCKSALYTANVVPENVNIGDSVSFGEAIRRFGNSIRVVGGNIVTKGCGDYNFVINVDYTGASTGTTATTFTVYDNGQPIPGAKKTVTTGASAVEDLTIPFMAKNTCCMEHIITVVVSGQNITNVTASATVTKIRETA